LLWEFLVAIPVVCPQCEKQFKVPEELVGRRGKCPQCQAVFQIASSPDVEATTLNVKTAGARSAKAKSSAISEPDDVVQLFQGRVEPVRVGLFRKTFAFCAIGILVLMPVLYFAVMVGVVVLMWWLATSPWGRTIPPAVFWMLEVGLGVVLVCLLKSLLEPRGQVPSHAPLTIDQEPVLARFVAEVCQQSGARMPQIVQLEFSPSLRASNRRGWLGFPRPEVTLTLGVPLIACLSVKQLAGLLAEHLAHHRRGAGCYVMNLIRGINGWLYQCVYGRSRFDEWLGRIAQRPQFQPAKLLVPLGATAWVSRAVLFVPMFIANTFASSLIGKAELDADRLAVRMMGQATFASLLAQLEMTDFAWQGVLAELSFLHEERQLPDSLPDQLASRMLDTTYEVYLALRDTLHKPQEAQFSSRLSNAERVAATAGENGAGVVNSTLPARALFRAFDVTARKMTWDYYVETFGPQFLKTSIKVVVPERAVAT
jgi:hypothetical protein